MQKGSLFILERIPKIDLKTEIYGETIIPENLMAKCKIAKKTDELLVHQQKQLKIPTKALSGREKKPYRSLLYLFCCFHLWLLSEVNDFPYYLIFLYTYDVITLSQLIENVVAGYIIKKC